MPNLIIVALLSQILASFCICNLFVDGLLVPKHLSICYYGVHMDSYMQ